MTSAYVLSGSIPWWRMRALALQGRAGGLNALKFMPRYPRAGAPGRGLGGGRRSRRPRAAQGADQAWVSAGEPPPRSRSSFIAALRPAILFAVRLSSAHLASQNGRMFVAFQKFRITITVGERARA